MPGQQVEFLLEGRLWGSIPLQLHLVPAIDRSATKFQHREGLEQGLKRLAAHVELLWGAAGGPSARGCFQLGEVLLCPLEMAVEVGGDKVGVAYKHPCDRRDVFQKMHPLLAEQVLLNVGDERHQTHLVGAELAHRVKNPDALNFLAQKFDAVGQFMPEAEHIKDAPSHTVLSRLVHKVAALKSVFLQCFDDEVHAGGFTFSHLQGVAHQRPLVDHLLAEGLSEGDDELPAALGVVELVEHLRPLKHIGIVNFLDLVGPLVGGREIEDVLLGHQGLEVVVEIEGLLLVVENDEGAALSEAVGADVSDVVLGMGYDPRIGPDFLKPGPGYGGSCFPKDISALLHTARTAGYHFDLLDGVVAVNVEQRERVVEKIRSAAGGSLEGAAVAIWGLTFKANTDDLRDSPALAVIDDLLAAGASVRAHDPAIAIAPTSGMELVSDPVDAVRGAQVLALLTEWDVYRWVDPLELITAMASPNIVDARNLLDFQEWRKAGFRIQGIGRL